MKVAFIEDSVEMGGVQFSTYFLAEHLMNEKSADVRIFLPGEGPFSILCQGNTIPYSIYNSIPYISTSISLFNDKLRIPNPLAWVYNICAILLNSIRIKNKLKQHVPHLAVTKGLLTHFSAGLACKSTDLPIVWHLQDLVTVRYYGLLNSFFNQLANKIPDHVVCDGQIIKDSLKGPVCERSSVVLNGIKTEDLERCVKSRDKVRKELGIPVNAYVIGNLARITPWKGQVFLVWAFIEYAKQNKNAYLLLAGSPLFDNDKYHRLLEKLISKSDLWDRVIMPGYRSDLKSIFSAMDLFVYPSVEKDTTPLALLSALAAGLPVAISRIDSLEDVVSHCPSIDLFHLEENDSLVRLMQKYENPKLRMEKGMKNQGSASNNFDILIHAQQITGIFRAI